ncbi:hypothetical protein D6C13_18275 [Rahnella woolbedingensis]|uniref:Uncharacterized protein n=1 Tax=Rahnella woolbedingensis TaxID=1510574 RepID=A0A419N5E8_9GAMM|nr:hypothetical protein D6C13_18275 [Rahnella woolbedingensis]
MEIHYLINRKSSHKIFVLRNFLLFRIFNNDIEKNKSKFKDAIITCVIKLNEIVYLSPARIEWFLFKTGSGIYFAC